MDRDRSNATPSPSPSLSLSLSRRQLLAAAGAASAVAAVGSASAVAQPRTGLSLSFSAATNSAATLAPGGDRLIAEIQNVLWSLPRIGGRAIPLTPAGLEPNRPVYAPDGKLIAFCAYEGGGFHVWTMRPDGSDVRQRTGGPWDDRGPAWSPDGTRLAFASERGGDPVAGSPYRIHVLDLSTGELTRVGRRPRGSRTSASAYGRAAISCCRASSSDRT